MIGAKKQKGQARKPHIAKDDLVSVELFKGLYGLCEGEIYGLADGGKSIRLDGTPIVNDNGQPNFADVAWEMRTGTLDQAHIEGFPAVENEIGVGVQLRHDRPFVRAITNRDLSAVRVRLNFNALRETKDNGDIVGYAIEYAIDIQTDGGAYQEVLNTAVRGKASQGFKRSHRIDLPKASRNWTIRVRRITPNRDSELIADTVSVEAITEIIDAKLRYPATALLGLSYHAKTFGNIAKLAVRLKGKLIQVPTNYNPDTRTYSGLWDGTFKLAYSNNPAWVFYDICTHKRYGLGERLAGMVDKWRLYQIAQYCDEPVDDGKGGSEPRFAINVYIQRAEDAYSVLQSIAGVFRGMSFWDGSHVIVDSDTPKDPVYTFSPANVVGGEFSYTGTRARDRHSVVRVAWDNPDDDYKTEYEWVRDELAITKYGIRQLDINAFGCTSLGQAQRAGIWALKSEQLETRMVTFKTGLQGFIPQVGQIINIADDAFAGRAISGRIMAVNAKQITLDRVAGKVGDTISTGGQIAKITAVSGNKVTLDKAVGKADDIWAVISDDLKLMQFRVLAISQADEAGFEITALQYEPQKYTAVDTGAIITPQSFAVPKYSPITAPDAVTITANTRTHQGQSVTTMTISWGQVTGAVSYIVEWRKDDGNWQTLPKVAGQSVDIDGVYAGAYIARVRAVDSFDSESLATASTLTQIIGKTGKPPRPASLSAKGILFGMELTWVFNAGSGDTNYTEVQVSPDGRSNIATLGQFAYPTDKHTVTGLQGNLRQFYRARIVDKLGNTSDWTAWVSGTTSAQADKVLDLISGQISQSHLDRSLRTPIAKIPTLETSVSKINADLPRLNQSIADERARISSAIVDINTLKQSDGAKSLELANLTKAVSGHTSSIRDLGVTTGNLSQKYSQLKTVADKATSDITQIKQTQTGQATSIDRLDAKFDNLAVGGRNLLRASNNTRNFDYGTRFELTQAPNVGDDVVVTIWGEIGSDRDGRIGVYNSHGWTQLFVCTKIADGVYQGKGRWGKPIMNGQELTPNDTHLNVYFYPRTATSNNRIDKIKLERGNIATDWTPAPEDSNVDLSGYATTATLDEFKQAQATKDSATAQSLQTLQTTVGQHTASIQQHSQSLNGLSAQWTLKVQSGGVVSGIGLASSHGVSDFAIRADKFYIAPPTGGDKGSLPFTVKTSTSTVNGVQAPAGTYINDAYIGNGSITSVKIANAAIDSVKIANAAITAAKIGDGQIVNAKIANGAITTAKIGTAQVDTLQIAGEAVIVPRLQYSPQDFEFYSIDTEEEINRVSLDARGGAVSIQFTFEKLTARSGGNNDGSNGRVIIRIKRNNITLRTISLDGEMITVTPQSLGDHTLSAYSYKVLNYNFVTLATLIDTPPQGEQVYTVTLESRALNAGKSSSDSAKYPVVIKARSFQILGVRR